LASGSSILNGTLTAASNLTFNGGTNVFKLGGVADDRIVVGGNLNFASPTKIKINPVGPLGTHILYQYSGTLSGTNNISFVTPRPLTCTLNTSTSGVVAVTISGTVTLSWKGGAAGNPTEWNTTTTNWLNGASASTFVNGDYVSFGDSALTNAVNFSNTVS